MIITDMQRRGKSELYKIFIDEEYVCLFEAEIIVKNHLRIGTEISEAKFDEMRAQSENITCFSMALNYVSKCLKTKKQIKDYLKEKSFLKVSIDEALQKLETYKYIDDRYFAECYVNSKKTSKGVIYIKQQLQLKGVNEFVINDVLKDYSTDLDAVTKLVIKFMKNKQKDKKNKEKLYRHLQGKGFLYEDFKNILDNYFGDENDWNWYIGN